MAWKHYHSDFLSSQYNPELYTSFVQKTKAQKETN
jgi:hypothetical protein